MTRIGPVPPDAARDGAFVDALVDLVNRAYVIAEAGLWRDGVTRTTPAETTESILAGQVVVARDGAHVIGAVLTRLLDPGTGWFGGLAVDPAHGGRGIGGLLVAHAEARAAVAGATAMQLEILRPARGHAHTDRLAAWYERLGYRETERVDLADVDPAAVPFLVQPLDVAVMRKRLPPAAR